MKTISPNALHSQLCSGANVTLLDVRSAAEHAQARIAGSQSLPLSKIPATDFSRITNHSSQEIYLVCHSGRLSRMAFDSLDAEGSHQVVLVEGGLVAWVQARLPLERAPVKALSLDRQVRIVAGSLILLGLLLGKFVHPAFVGLTGFVGGGLAFAGLSGWCGMAGLLARARWNRSGDELSSTQPAGYSAQA